MRKKIFDFTLYLIAAFSLIPMILLVFNLDFSEGFVGFGNALLVGLPYIINSVIIIIPITLFSHLVSLLGAYELAYGKSKRNVAILIVMAIVALLPGQVMMIPNYLITGILGIRGGYLSVILPGIFYPVGVVILTIQMRTIPRNILEAAKLDGASAGLILLKIVIPNIKFGISVVSLILFSEYWNLVDFSTIYLMDEKKKPMSSLFGKMAEAGQNVYLINLLIYMLPPLLLGGVCAYFIWEYTRKDKEG